MNVQVHPEIQIGRKGNGAAINAQIISLLHLVDETGSIPDACDMARLDLLSAWKMLAQAEDALGFPLFQYVQHKSFLTEKARKLMDAYDQFEAAVQANANKLYESLPFIEASL